jgi:hypothetical protein
MKLMNLPLVDISKISWLKILTWEILIYFDFIKKKSRFLYIFQVGSQFFFFKLMFLEQKIYLVAKFG